MSNETTRLATAAEKRRMALELRMAGMNYQDIADEVGWKSKASAYKAVMQELRNIPREAANELRTMQLETLNAAKLSIFEAVRGGDVFAVDRLMKLLDHEAKLTGLYRDVEDSQATVQVKDALAAFLAAAVASDGESDAGDDVGGA